MSLESIEQKIKALLEAYYELEKLKISNAPKNDLAKQGNYIKSLADAIKPDIENEKE